MGVPLRYVVFLLDVLLDVPDALALQVAVKDDLPHVAQRFRRQALYFQDVLRDPAPDGLIVDLALVVVIQQVYAQGVLDRLLPLAEGVSLGKLGYLLDLFIKAEGGNSLLQGIGHLLEQAPEL